MSANFELLKPQNIIHEGFASANPKIRIFKWSRPNIQYKLNVDAPFLHDSSQGGATLCNRVGDLNFGICFYITTDSVFELRLKLYIMRLSKQQRWDLVLAISMLQDASYYGRWKVYADEIRRVSKFAKLVLRPLFREGN
ncbi:unnamed protein product [Cuscuta europaea]|uniref:Uncharacterized protein n=1 Tax=Cuscuta europaea TaxID=41803 RepID=A0A9P0YWW4_CUSEU|nr:unnamed protein product [Cuscuta europaea]